jgi:hypothetical protein
VTVKELLDAVRVDGEEPGFDMDSLARVARVEELMAAMDEALAGGLRGQTWRDLADAAPPAESPVRS